MTKQICVVSPKCTSKSAKWLAETLNADYDNPYQSGKYDYEEYKHVINFGYSGVVLNDNIINDHEYVYKSVDKILTFQAIDGHCRCVPWTTDKAYALSWAKEGNYVVVREHTKGNRSSGITITNKLEEINAIDAKLYTKYIDYKTEYRVNVLHGKVISVLEKLHGDDGNFVFKLIRKSPYTFNQFIRAIDKYIGLDLYGLDIILGRDNKLYFLEVNSGPILFGQTAIQMASTLKKELKL